MKKNAIKIIFLLCCFVKIKSAKIVDERTAVEQAKIKKLFSTFSKSSILLEKQKIIEQALRDGIDINVQNQDGHTLLMYYLLFTSMTKSTSFDDVKLLLDNGANVTMKAVDALSKEEDTALLIMARRSDASVDKRIIDALLSHGADVDQRYIHNQTLLMLAVDRNITSLVQLLLDAKVNINAVDNAGATALMRATQEYFSVNNLDIFSLLIAKGADLKIKNNKGDTLLHSATLVAPDSEDPSDIGKILFEYVKNKTLDLEAKNSEGDTVLVDAVSRNQKNKAIFLIKNGADYTQLNKNGATLLMLAAGQCSGELVLFLLKHTTIPVNAVDKDGKTAVNYALKANNKFCYKDNKKNINQNIGILQFLRDNGAAIPANLTKEEIES